MTKIEINLYPNNSHMGYYDLKTGLSGQALNNHIHDWNELTVVVRMWFTIFLFTLICRIWRPHIFFCRGLVPRPGRRQSGFQMVTLVQ